jgi:hypothetical protein
MKTGNLSSIGESTSRYSLAGYELFFGSLSRALELLKPLEKMNSELPTDLQNRIQLLQAFAHLKAANWDRAEYFGSLALDSAARAGDLVQQANALNNLACVALESGNWERAHAHLSMIEEKLEALEAAHDATLPLRMNKANILFYQGRPAEALAEYLECRTLAQRNGIGEFEPELVACVGLTTLQLGDRQLVDQSWDALRAYPPDSLLGVQERFKIEWFRSYMRARTGDIAGVQEDLRNLAALYHDKDRLESGKLAWLSFQLGDRWKEDEIWNSELDRMSDLGIRWFGFFCRRWMRQVRQA